VAHGAVTVRTRWVRHHKLERTQRLRVPPAEAFAFFADAFNLEAITPPWLRFRILTPRPVSMGEGTLLDYRLRLHGIPIRWHTRIEVWEPGRRFVDRQLRGPYRLWHHTHSFASDGRGGTIMRDTVRYALPLGPLGALAHLILVRRDVNAIFDHRARQIEAQLHKVK